jgi:hypothetical protein
MGCSTQIAAGGPRQAAWTKVAPYLMVVAGPIRPRGRLLVIAPATKEADGELTAAFAVHGAGDRRAPTRCSELAGSGTQVPHRDAQDSLEASGLGTANSMLQIERVRCELLMDAVGILRSRKRLADPWWPGHEPIVPGTMDAPTVKTRWSCDGTTAATVASMSLQVELATGTYGGFQNASITPEPRSSTNHPLPKTGRCAGTPRVEPAGIEPATSCLQSRSVCPLVSRSVA